MKAPSIKIKRLARYLLLWGILAFVNHQFFRPSVFHPLNAWQTKTNMVANYTKHKSSFHEVFGLVENSDVIARNQNEFAYYGEVLSAAPSDTMAIIEKNRLRVS